MSNQPLDEEWTGWPWAGNRPGPPGPLSVPITSEIKEVRMVQPVHACLGVFSAVALMMLSSAAQARENEHRAEPARDGLTWNSAQMRDLEREWLVLAQGAASRTDRQSEGSGGGASRTWGEPDREALSLRDMRNLAASCDALPVDPKRWSPFVNAVMTDVIERLDRDRLVTTLATRCPFRLGTLAVEYSIASGAPYGLRCRDPILVLCEAYAKCKHTEVRRILFYYIRRAFAGHGITGTDGAPFVRNAVQWYEANKDHLAFNPAYDYAEAVSGVLDYEHGADWSYPVFLDKCPNPLFKLVPASQVRPRPAEAPAAGDLPGPPNSAEPPDVRTEAQRLAELQGTWDVVSVVYDGTPMPREENAGHRFVFREGALGVARPSPRYQYRVRLGPAHDGPDVGDRTPETGREQALAGARATVRGGEPADHAGNLQGRRAALVDLHGKAGIVRETRRVCGGKGVGRDLLRAEAPRPPPPSSR